MKALNHVLLPLLASGLLALHSAPLLAQDSETGQMGVHSPGAGSSQGLQEGKPQVAQAGAGTDDGTTTGSSGPQPKKSGKPGEINVPPLPSASQCDDYKNTPAHQSCLAVVLRQNRS